jgi:hypothetical protein
MFHPLIAWQDKNVKTYLFVEKCFISLLSLDKNIKELN